MVTKDIKDFTKYPSLSDDDYLLGTKTDLDGTDAGIRVADFKKQIAQDINPQIKNGCWWVNGINTGQQATGKTPEFLYTTRGLEMKYKDEDDTAYQVLIPIEDLLFTFDDLTPDQKKEIKGERGYSAFEIWQQLEGNADKAIEDYLAYFRRPATEAAQAVTDQMDKISQEASQKMTDLRQLEATVSEQEETRENFYTQTQAAEQGRQNDELKRKEAAAAAAEAERLRVLKEEERNATFNTKIQEASDAAAEAKTQGDYAKRQGDKATLLAGRVSDLEEGKVDGGYAENGELQLTSNGLPVGDPIPVGSGGGGGGTGGGGVLMKVRAIGETLISAIQGGTLRIGYNFVSTYMDDQSETGDGTATYLINSQKVATEAITQGDNYFDVTKYLVLGTNKVKVTVLDSTGQSRSVLFTVEVISLSISDSYDDTQINAGEITYRYTPSGAIAKTVHFILDDEEIGTETTSVSNRQLSFVIPAQTHGAHRLVTYMTATVNGVEVRSNELAHDLICVTAGNDSIIVASSFNQATAKQYDRLLIPFVVYSPAASTSAVTLSVNGEVLSEQTVDRTKHEWNYRITKPGALALKIASGDVSRTFNLDVSEAGIIVEPETADLSLFLTAANRSNNDNNKEEWKFNDITANLSDFNYKTNGWINENGSTVLRVSGDARVAIPYHIFANDFRASGKTIEFEFETRDVIDYDAVVIDCLAGGIGLQVTAQEALFKSEQTTVSTRFKEEERVRVSFVVEKKIDNRLIYIYINGVLSGVAQYPNDDNFQQAAPIDIMIGSNDCTVDLFNIRVYDNNLTEYQMLDNYIADIDDYDRKVEIYNRNQVYDEYGNISYQKVLEKIPCMILEGPLPTFKGDKKTNKVYFADLQSPARDFSCNNIQNDVQGTSSQYYPRKNFKYKFKAQITYTGSGEMSDNYALRSDSIPVNCFCLKADFAESSGTHNTGMARIVDKLLKDMGILTPPQQTDPRVRTTVDGYPICVFHRETADGELTFVGKYNFNNDKSTEATFGFTEGDESWEFKNNTSDRSLFKSADFTSTDWLNDFEARYPDDDTINAEYEAGSRKPVNLMAVMEWVVSTKGDSAKFKAEVAEHFDLRNLLSYYLITELFGMVDQRAKNMFLTRFAKDGKWRFIFYDNDTCNGINNEGLIAFGYGVEYHDTIDTLNVFNGEQSVLWNNVEAAFGDELAEMYREMRTYLSYSSVMDVLNGGQSDKWCEAIYNADGRFKYVDPLIEDGNGSYLYACQGSRAEHRKWWLFNRFLYMDSKYNAGDFLTDYATMRLYTPQSYAGVEPDADFTIVPFADQYVRVKYGSYIIGKRCKKDVPVTIEAPAIQFNDTETIIYGASRVKSLGNLAGKYAGTIDMSKAVRLSELHIGSDVEGYHNDNLTILSVGANKMLRTLDIQNCPNLIQPVELSQCENIEEVFAQGTSITSVVLSTAGILYKLYLPGTVTNLTLKNQPKLSDAFFKLASVEKLSTIVCESTPGVNIFPIVDRCLSIKNPVLNRVRLIDINATGANLDILYKLIKLGGVDEKGNNVPTAVVTGKFHAVTAVEDKLAAIRAAFPELTVTYTNLKPPTITTFTFSSSLSKTIQNPVFECNFGYRKINNYTYEVTADDDSVIEFTFKCDDHDDYIATYTVFGTRTQNYSVLYVPLRTIRLKIFNKETYLSGAQVSIGDDVYMSDKDGCVRIRTRAGIEGAVTAAGYNKITFSYPESLNDTSHTLLMYPTVEVKFIVKNQFSGLVAGATVSCEGKSAETNIYGECVLVLERGTFDYTVTCPEHYDYAGKITVGTSASTETVKIDLIATTLMPEENGNIQMLLIGSSVIVNVTSETANYVINWGDGSSTNASGAGAKTYNHSYTTNLPHNIEISDCADVIYAQSPKNNLAAYWSIGNSGVSGLTFTSYGELLYVGYVFKNDVNRTDLSYLFATCFKLQSIDLTILANMVNATNLSSLLEKCRSLTTIDLTPLAGMVNVTVINSLLCGCSGLTSVDLSPLAGMVKVTELSYLLSGCSGLTSVDLSPLAGMVNVMSLPYLLADCSGLTSVDLTPLAGMVNATDLSCLLADCSGLTSVDLSPLAGMVNAMYLTYLLRGCFSLTYILIANATPGPISSDSFYNTNDCPIYVPAECVDIYKSATNWSVYADRIKPMSDFATDFPDEV